MREKGQIEVAKTLETPVFSRGIEILTEKVKLDEKIPAAGVCSGDTFIVIRFDLQSAAPRS